MSQKVTVTNVGLNPDYIAKTALLERLRASILFLLRDRRWHPVKDLLTRGFQCLIQGDILLGLSPEDASGRDPQRAPFPDKADLILGGKRLIQTAIDSLIEAGCCKSRGAKLQQEVRRQRVDNRSQKRVAAMAAIERAVLALAHQWLKEGRSVTQADLDQEIGRLVVEKIGKTDQYPDLNAYYPICHALQDWLAAQPVARTNPVRKSTKRAQPPVTPRRPLAKGPTAELFDEPRMFYFRGADVNWPTRVNAKVLAITALLAKDKPMPADGLIASLRVWVSELLAQTPQGLLTEYLGALADWADGQGLQVPPRGKDDFKAAFAFVNRIAREHVDWEWLLGLLRRELGLHSHRRENRALELATGQAYEYLEAGKDGPFSIEEVLAWLGKKNRVRIKLDSNETNGTAG
jgi:hypothetical protein